MANRSNIPATSRWLVGLGLASLAVSFSVAGLAFYTPAKGEAPPPSSAHPASTARRAVAVAFVDTWDGVRALTPVRAGRVAEVQSEGASAKKGDVLLRIDDTLAKLDLRKAEAGLAIAKEQLAGARMLANQHRFAIEAMQGAVTAAQADLESAQAQVDKANRFHKAELGPTLEDVKAAEGQLAKATAGVAARKAELKKLLATDPERAVATALANIELKKVLVAEAREGVELCLVRAPCDGTLLRVTAAVGEVLSTIPNPQKPAPLIFCSRGPRIIRAEVEQEFARKVSVGQHAVIYDDATGDSKWTGKVARVGDWYTHRRVIQFEPMQFNDVRTLEVIVSVDEGGAPLRIGQRLRVMLEGMP